MSLPVCFIVDSSGVREALDMRICRRKDGRLHQQVRVFAVKGDATTAGQGRWVDDALVFKTEEEATSAFLWARLHRARHNSKQSIPRVLVGVDYIASLAL